MSEVPAAKVGQKWILIAYARAQNRIIECAAIDTRKSYLNCEFFLKWFWFTVATKSKLVKPRMLRGFPPKREG